MPSRPVAATKLTIPGLPRTVIGRPMLTAQLDDSTWRVALVSAPAGFGKTILLSAWARSQIDAPAWFSCDIGDSEPIRFWTGLIASLSTRWPGVGDDALVALRRAGTEDRSIAVSLANDLAEITQPTIVIDDLHLSKPAPPVLVAFIDALPSDARLIIGTRHQPPLSFARRRLAGDLLELATNDLRFSVREAAEFLRAQDVELSPDELERLHELTEGWPAALELAALSLRRASSHDRFLDALSATTGPMADFLASEVLAGLPDDWVDFLLQTSVLEEFDVALCERLTGRVDAGLILDDLVRAGMFVVPLDDIGEWYRYHHLFAALMRARLRARDVTRSRQIRAAAAAALEERGLVVAAIHQHFANDDADSAGAIAMHALERLMLPVDVESTEAAVRAWLNEHGRTSMVNDPILVLGFIGTLSSTGGTDEVGRWLQLVADAHPNPPAEVRGYLGAVWCDFHLNRGDAVEAMRHIDSAMSAFDGAPPNWQLLPLLNMIYVRACLSVGDIDAAGATLDRLAEHPVGVAVLDDVRCPAMRAWVSFLYGDLDAALRLGRRSLDRADELSLAVSEPGRLFASLAIAGVETERLNDSSAQEAMTLASRSAESSERAWFRWYVLLEQARMARVRGDAPTAESHLALARAMLSFPTAQMAQAASQEAAAQAVRFRTSSADTVDAGDDSPTMTKLRIRRALQRGDSRLATSLVDLLPVPETTRDQVDYEMLRAGSSVDLSHAIVHLEAALETAQRAGFLRSVIDATPNAADLLAAFPARGDLQPYLDIALAAAAARLPVVRTEPATPLIEPLSEREVMVLRYLSSRLTNPEIAAALYISINTLKTHVKAIYRKLAVSARTEAVEVGRRLGII